MNASQIEAFYPLTLAVRRLFHKLGSGVGALHGSSEVSAGMRAVLESVVDGGPQTVPQMARVRPVSRQHIQGLVNPLLEHGYVEYIDNPFHKRSKLVAPTPKGVETFRRMRELENEAFDRIKLDITPAEFAAATRVLEALIDVFGGPQWEAIVAAANDRPDEA